jgi:hypothetical protein
MNSDYPEIELYLSILSPYAVISTDAKQKHLLQLALHEKNMKVKAKLIQDIGRSLLDQHRIIPLVLRSYVHAYKHDRINLDQMTSYDGDLYFAKVAVKQ